MKQVWMEEGKIYTGKIHAKNLVRLLRGEKGQPCGECPAEIDWDRGKKVGHPIILTKCGQTDQIHARYA